MTYDQSPAGDSPGFTPAGPWRTVNTAQMVTVSFARAGQEFARIVLDGGRLVRSSGDVTWLDLSVVPYSERLGRPVRFTEDAEEWARSLPGAYAGMHIEATLTQTSPVASSMPGDDPSLGAVAGPLQLAGWWSRAAAMLIDSLIIGAPAAALSQALFGLHAWATRSANGASAGIFWDWKQILLAVALGFGYFVLRTTRIGARNGQTIGKRAMRIRVVRDDGLPVDTRTAMLRYGTLYGLSLLFGVGSLLDYLWPLGDSSKRALHDKAAATHVVSTVGPGQSRRNPAWVIVIAGIGFVVLIGAVIAVAAPSSNGQDRPSAATQSAYVAASQLLVQAEQASAACAVSANHSGPFSEPSCMTAKVRALAIALGNLWAANANAQSGVSAGPCATALSHEGQAIHATETAVDNALQALQAGDSAAFRQAQQQAAAAQQAAAGSEAEYPLSACDQTPGLSAPAAA